MSQALAELDETSIVDPSSINDVVCEGPCEHVDCHMLRGTMPYVPERITKDEPGATAVEIHVGAGDAANQLAGFLEHVARIVRATGGVELTARPLSK